MERIVLVPRLDKSQDKICLCVPGRNNECLFFVFEDNINVSIKSFFASNRLKSCSPEYIYCASIKKLGATIDFVLLGEVGEMIQSMIYLSAKDGDSAVVYSSISFGLIISKYLGCDFYVRESFFQRNKGMTIFESINGTAKLIKNLGDFPNSVLFERLSEAIKEENYELAILIKEEIKKRNL